jgi:hypothetical protein
MAYFSQAMKQERAGAVKAILKKYGVKGSLAVRNHSTFVLNVKSGPINFLGNYKEVQSNNPRYYDNDLKYIDVNVFWYKEHFSGVAREFLSEVIEAMNQGNFDKSDIQTDYFCVGWYLDVNIGQWNKPYELVA